MDEQRPTFSPTFKHQESYNLRDSSIGLSETAAYAIPLSEQVQNLGIGFFEKKSFDKSEGGLANKSFLTQQPANNANEVGYDFKRANNSQKQDRANSYH